jgi:SM-20-related protein
MKDLCSHEISDHEEQERLFARIADDLVAQGCSIQLNALPSSLAKALLDLALDRGMTFQSAGIGRAGEHLIDGAIRNDEISWIDATTPVGSTWLEWTADLQRHLNRHLYLGLFSFESHLAHYDRGAFYKKHLDAFHGEANRILTLVAYLNLDWKEEDGGELIIYSGDNVFAMVPPEFATLVVFLSEEFPHEVLPARRDRYSVAGWFRLNASSSQRVDPAF